MGKALKIAAAAAVTAFGILIVAGAAPAQKKTYDLFETPQRCAQCHKEIHTEWKSAMMSQAYTHHWDEIEYFKLAVAQAEKDPKVAEVKAGCNGCHAPAAFFIGDTPPPLPSAGSRANESVACDICHTISGFKGDVPHNFNYVLNPGKVKYGPREGLVSPFHETKYSDFVKSADFCGTCHNEMDPYGLWVKSTHLEWKEGPYSKQGVRCQDCHMWRYPGKSADMGQALPDMAHHNFPGAHVPSKYRGTIEMKVYADAEEIRAGRKGRHSRSTSTTPRPGTNSRPARWRTASSGSRCTPWTPRATASSCPWTKRASRARNSRSRPTLWLTRTSAT